MNSVYKIKKEEIGNKREVNLEVIMEAEVE